METFQDMRYAKLISGKYCFKQKRQQAQNIKTFVKKIKVNKFIPQFGTTHM